MTPNQKPTKEMYNKWHQDPNNWVWGVFYYNKEDDTVFLSKRNPLTGTTVNFANPIAFLAIIAFLTFAGFIAYMCANK